MVTEIIDRLLQKPTEKDIISALQFRGDEQLELFKAAKKHHSQKVYVRAVLELSNYCRQNCKFCGMRRENEQLERFRVSPEKIRQLVDSAISIPEVDIVHFSFGEDWQFPFDTLVEEIEKIYRHNKSVNLVLGELPRKQYQKLFDAAKGFPIRYTLKMETTDVDFFDEIKDGWKYSKRLNHLNILNEIGFETCSGIIVGLPGQSLSIVANDILFLINQKGLVNLSASTFTPSPQSPYEKEESGDVDMTMNTMALLRLLTKNPNITIPASGTLGKEKQKLALIYFANLLSIHIIPSEFQNQYLIYNGGERTFGELEKIYKTIENTPLKLNQLEHEQTI